MPQATNARNSAFAATIDAGRIPEPVVKSSELTEQIRRSRGGFAALVTAYACEVFNDQFFKQTAMLLIVGSAGPGYLQLVFMSAFVLLAAPSGWLADRFSKRTVIISAKIIELIAVLLGAYGLFTDNWPLIFCGIAIMGLRGTVFTPAINGSIPELYPDHYVTKANGVLKVFTTLATLMGIALAGFALGIERPIAGVPFGRTLVAGGMVLVAAIGIVVSLRLLRKPSAEPNMPFPWTGPLQTIRTFARIRRDRLLTTVIFADAYFWFLGALLVQLINELGKSQFGYKPEQTSCLALAEAVGVVIGGLLSPRLATGPRWYRVLAPSAAVLGIMLALMVAVPALPGTAQFAAMLLILAIAGIAGGLFVIPQESFIQVRPSPQEKGTIISTANVAAFSGMLLAGPASILLNRYLQPTLSFGVMAGVTVLVGCWLWRALRENRIHD